MCELNICLFVCFIVVVLKKVYKHICTEHIIKSMQFPNFLMHNVQQGTKVTLVPSKKWEILFGGRNVSKILRIDV